MAPERQTKREENMKARRISEPTFKPITIEVTLETQIQAKTMYSLFNRNGIPLLDDFDVMRAAIGHEVYDKEVHKKLWADIKENLNYEEQ